MFENIFSRNNSIQAALLACLLTTLLFLSTYWPFLEFFLTSDDYQNFMEVQNRSFENLNPRVKRLYINPYISYFVMFPSLLHPAISRAIVLLIGIFPLLYFTSQILLYKKSFRPVEVFLILGIFILVPGQVTVPIFIIGSYHAWALALLFLSLWLYLQSTTTENVILKYVLAIVVYWLAVETSELNVFLVPLFLIFSLPIKNRKNYFLFLKFLPFLLIAIYKAARTILMPWGNNQANSIDLEIIYERLARLPEFISPLYFQDISHMWNWMIFGTLLVISISALGWHWKKLSILYKRIIYLSFIGFVLSMLPFLFFTKGFSDRYFFVSAFFVSIFIGTGIIRLIGTRKYFTGTMLIFIALFFIVPYSLKQGALQDRYAKHIQMTDLIRNKIASANLPYGAQIVITGHIVGWTLKTHGFWPWSSGFIRFVTGRKDLKGMVANYTLGQNSFDISKRRYPFRHSGLTVEEPLFGYFIKSGKIKAVSKFYANHPEKDGLIHVFDPITGDYSGNINASDITDLQKEKIMWLPEN